MKVKRIDQIPATERAVVDHLVCDICGAKSGNEEWEGNGYADRKTTVEMVAGENYGADGGSLTTLSFDICPACFKSKLIPWMASHGATPASEDTDW